MRSSLPHQLCRNWKEDKGTVEERRKTREEESGKGMRMDCGVISLCPVWGRPCPCRLLQGPGWAGKEVGKEGEEGTGQGL